MRKPVNDSIEDFEISPLPKGYYQVTYTSPKTKKQWSKETDDHELIEKIKQGKNLVTNLTKLKWICKI